MKNLEDLAFRLNTFETDAGTRFAAEYLGDSQTLQVSCDLNPDALIFIVISEEQILAVTPLFTIDEIKADSLPTLYETLLRLSPVIPLSSIGLQDHSCILFGAMPVNTLFENIAHELECQADNYTEVLAALADYFDTDGTAQEASS